MATNKNNYERVYCSLPVMLKELLSNIDNNLKNDLLTRALFKYFTEGVYKELRHAFPSKGEYEEFESLIHEIYGEFIQNNTQPKQVQKHIEKQYNKVSSPKKTKPKKNSSPKPKEIPIQNQEIDMDEMYDEFEF